MNMHAIPVPEELMSDYRAFFPKQLTRYLETGDLNWRELGQHYVSLHQICWHLWDDEGLFPSHFHSLMKRVCGHEYRIWERKSGSYGGAARTVAAHIDNYLMKANGHPRAPMGWWVDSALNANKPSTDWLLLEDELKRLPVNAA
ncbi:hypothetical protein [Rhizobium sp. YS-1r]|uniref:hypothetical protein n=1 Tax=Rhizobium sp. YS-1r TaxID=1532558 RepID=UPI00050E1C43|nr:hypothetical protein [Rhizobium sp. YS-1r]KGD95697.1 hypothetical protein JL39_19755 [Rhizobium sp. YS-1r]